MASPRPPKRSKMMPILPLDTEEEESHSHLPRPLPQPSPPPAADDEQDQEDEEEDERHRLWDLFSDEYHDSTSCLSLSAAGTRPACLARRARLTNLLDGLQSSPNYPSNFSATSTSFASWRTHSRVRSSLLLSHRARSLTPSAVNRLNPSTPIPPSIIHRLALPLHRRSLGSSRSRARRRADLGEGQAGID